MSVGPLDAEAFVDAFARCGRALWVLAAAWVGRGEANDLVQEAARIAWERRTQFVPGTEFRAWMAQIVRNTGANWRRRKRPAACDPAALPEPFARAERGAGWPFEADAAGLPDELAAALRGLPEVARSCLLLHVVAELPFAQIATMLDLPENTAMSHARRARLALRAALQPAAPAPTALPRTP